MKFSENLIKLRKKSNLSQEELGSKIGVARQTISKWENGETTPELWLLIELSKIFNVSIDELVGNDIKLENNCYKKNYYEFVSKTKIKNIPLVHINIGFGLRNLRTAKGIIAIGNFSKGIISIGGVAFGLLSLGGISIGLFALGGFAMALLLAIGALSIGTIAIGGMALGILAIGGLSVGIYSIGGCAIAKNIAAGGYAQGHIAIGEEVNGSIKFLTSNITESTSIEIKNAILKEFPNTWNIIVSIFSNII